MDELCPMTGAQSTVRRPTSVDRSSRPPLRDLDDVRRERAVMPRPERKLARPMRTHCVRICVRMVAFCRIASERPDGIVDVSRRFVTFGGIVVRFDSSVLPPLTARRANGIA